MTDLFDRSRPGGRDHLDDEVLSALIDDELPAGVASDAAGHRAGCPRCRRRSDELTGAAAAVAAAPPGGAWSGAPDARTVAAVAAAVDAVAAREALTARDAAAASEAAAVRKRAVGRRRGRRPAGAVPSCHRAGRTRVLVGALAVAGAALAVGGVHGQPGPDVPIPPGAAVRSVALSSSLGSFPTTGSLRATLEATVAAIDTTGPAAAMGATATLPCHQEASQAAELAAATSAVPVASGAAGPEAAFAAPVQLTDVPAEVFTFPRLAVAGVGGTVTRVGTYAVVVEDVTCAVVARLDW